MIVKAPEQKLPTAPEGTHSAVCVDEIDLGVVTTTFNGEERDRHMVRIVWQIDEPISDIDADRFNLIPGSRHIVKQDYTASLDEKAKLRKQLQSWRGRTFTQLELAGFDLETIVGVPCMLSVVHNQGRKGGVFSNVESVMKLPKGMEALKPEGYIRVKDRAVASPSPQPHHRAQPVPPPRVEEQPPEWHRDVITDDDVPF